MKHKQDESKPMTVAQMVEENPDRVIDRTTTTKKLTGGLAAAVGRRKKLRKKYKSPQQKELNTPGVRRI